MKIILVSIASILVFASSFGVDAAPQLSSSVPSDYDIGDPRGYYPPPSLDEPHDISEPAPSHDTEHVSSSKVEAAPLHNTEDASFSDAEPVTSHNIEDTNPDDVEPAPPHDTEHAGLGEGAPCEQGKNQCAPGLGCTRLPGESISICLDFFSLAAR
jgi:hypothetical protein